MAVYMEIKMCWECVEHVPDLVRIEYQFIPLINRMKEQGCPLLTSWSGTVEEVYTFPPIPLPCNLKGSGQTRGMFTGWET